MLCIATEAGELVVSSLLSSKVLEVAAYCAKGVAEQTCPGKLPEAGLLDPAAALFW